MKKILILLALAILPLGCAGGSKALLQNDFQLLKTDQLKAADEISAIKEANLKLAEKLNTQIGAGNSSEETHTSVGGDQTITNDSKLMERVLTTYQSATERFIRAQNRVIKSLCGFIGVLITLLGWIIKYLLKDKTRSDKAQEEMLEKELAKKKEALIK